MTTAEIRVDQSAHPPDDLVHDPNSTARIASSAECTANATATLEGGVGLALVCCRPQAHEGPHYDAHDKVGWTATSDA